jgi:hypothetical protein
MPRLLLSIGIPFRFRAEGKCLSIANESVMMTKWAQAALRMSGMRRSVLPAEGVRSAEQGRPFGRARQPIPVQGIFEESLSFRDILQVVPVKSKLTGVQGNQMNH